MASNTNLNRLTRVYYFLEYTLLFFNSTVILAGMVLFSYNITNVDKMDNSTIIENCDNVNLLNFLAMFNSGFVFISLCCMPEIQLFGFTTNIVLGICNYFNIIKISNECISYYNKFDFISIYYLYTILIQTTTLIFFIIILCIYMKYGYNIEIIKKKTLLSNESKNEEYQQLLSNYGTIGSGNARSGNIGFGNTRSGNNRSGNIGTGNTRTRNIGNVANTRNGNIGTGNTRNGNTRNGNTIIGNNESESESESESETNKKFVNLYDDIIDVNEIND